MSLTWSKYHKVTIQKLPFEPCSIQLILELTLPPSLPLVMLLLRSASLFCPLHFPSMKKTAWSEACWKLGSWIFSHSRSCWITLLFSYIITFSSLLVATVGLWSSFIAVYVWHSVFHSDVQLLQRTTRTGVQSYIGYFLSAVGMGDRETDTMLPQSNQIFL